MDELAKLKEKAIRIKDQIGVVDGVYQDLKQKAFMTEEILWDLKRDLETTQREIFSLLKDLDEDEKLAYKSGLAVAEIRFAKSLLTTGPSHGLSVKEVYLKKEVKPNAQKD